MTTEKGIVNGCKSIPTSRVVRAAGEGKNVKDWTTQVIDTLKFFVMEGTAG